LERLLAGYVIEEQQFWSKNPQNAWTPVDRRDALVVDPGAQTYGLGCLVLVRGMGG